MHQYEPAYLYTLMPNISTHDTHNGEFFPIIAFATTVNPTLNLNKSV